MDYSEFMKSQVHTNVKVKPVTNPDAGSRRLSLQLSPNVRAVLPQTSLGLATILPDPENREKSGNEISGILHVMPILTWKRQFHLAIGHSMEEQGTHPSA